MSKRRDDQPESTSLTESPRSKAGRPTKYQPYFARVAREACRLGATDRQLANMFGVTQRTINNWKIKYESFAKALKAGKEVADDAVERALYHRAVGYDYEVVKIFMRAGMKEPVFAHYREHLPGDVYACLRWLYNRRPDKWKNKPTAERGDDPLADFFRSLNGRILRPRDEAGRYDTNANQGPEEHLDIRKPSDNEDDR